jgi:hypothetical protein
MIIGDEPYYLAFLVEKHSADLDKKISLGLAAPDHIVPLRDASLEGTPSQALRARLRSVLSLRDALADISQQV